MRWICWSSTRAPAGGWSCGERPAGCGWRPRSPTSWASPRDRTARSCRRTCGSS